MSRVKKILIWTQNEKKSLNSILVTKITSSFLHSPKFQRDASSNQPLSHLITPRTSNWSHSNHLKELYYLNIKCQCRSCCRVASCRVVRHHIHDRHKFTSTIIFICHGKSPESGKFQELPELLAVGISQTLQFSSYFQQSMRVNLRSDQQVLVPIYPIY